MFQVRTGVPTEANGWTISVKGAWLRAIPDPPRKYVGTFNGVPMYSDDRLDSGTIILEPGPPIADICETCNGLSSAPDCVCDCGRIFGRIV